MPVEVLTKVYKPMLTVGQVYARPYGSTMLPLPIGNVLEMSLQHTEDVQKQPSMTRLGGGTHAEVRRVTDVQVSMKLADLNVVNMTRAVLGTVSGVDVTTVVDEGGWTVGALGSLFPLAGIGPSAVTVKKGATAGVASNVTMAGNYEIRPEGIYVLENAAAILPTDKLWVSYTSLPYAVIEALTAKSVELQLLFGGLNEADSGKPQVVDIWRASQGVTQALSLLNTGFGALDVTGTVLEDPTKTGAGVSKYYRQRVA
jgi:hypothetical protein